MKSQLKLLLLGVIIIFGMPNIYPDCISSRDHIPYDLVIKLYEGQQHFAIELLKTIYQHTKGYNLVFSPYSIYNLLLLMYFGSNGKTEEALYNILHLNWANDKGEVARAYLLDHNIRKIDSVNRSMEFISIDKIYFARQLDLLGCISETFKDNIDKLDFVNFNDGSLRIINEYVNETTKGHIDDFLAPGSITPQTTVTLVNAAYFKGTWLKAFDPSNTESGLFYNSDKIASLVEMMSITGSYKYINDLSLEFLFVEIPYFDGQRGGVSILLFLPELHSSAISNLLDRFTTVLLRRLRDEAVPRETKIKLPKISLKQSLHLEPVLSDMGLDDIFTNFADLRGYFNDGVVNVQFPHKVKIDIDEEGVNTPTNRIEIKADVSYIHAIIFDRPFVYMIYDYQTDSILFAGIYDKY